VVDIRRLTLNQPADSRSTFAAFRAIHRIPLPVWRLDLAVMSSRQPEGDAALRDSRVQRRDEGGSYLYSGSGPLLGCGPCEHT